MKTIELYSQVLKNLITRSFSIIYRIVCSLVHSHKSTNFSVGLINIIKLIIDFCN
jgi:hypothetical protein